MTKDKSNPPPETRNDAPATAAPAHIHGRMYRNQTTAPDIVIPLQRPATTGETNMGKGSILQHGRFGMRAMFM